MPLKTLQIRWFAVSTMDSEQRITQVISAMRSEIRKLELENMGLRRRAGTNLRKNATVPAIIAECRGRLTRNDENTTVFIK